MQGTKLVENSSIAIKGLGNFSSCLQLNISQENMKTSPSKLNVKVCPDTYCIFWRPVASFFILIRI